MTMFCFGAVGYGRPANHHWLPLGAFIGLASFGCTAANNAESPIASSEGMDDADLAAELKEALSEEGSAVASSFVKYTNSLALYLDTHEQPAEFDPNIQDRSRSDIARTAKRNSVETLLGHAIRLSNGVYPATDLNAEVDPSKSLPDEVQKRVMEKAALLYKMLSVIRDLDYNWSFDASRTKDEKALPAFVGPSGVIVLVDEHLRILRGTLAYSLVAEEDPDNDGTLRPTYRIDPSQTSGSDFSRDWRHLNKSETVDALDAEKDATKLLQAIYGQAYCGAAIGS